MDDESKKFIIIMEKLTAIESFSRIVLKEIAEIKSKNNGFSVEDNFAKLVELLNTEKKVIANEIESLHSQLNNKRST